MFYYFTLDNGVVVRDDSGKIYSEIFIAGEIVSEIEISPLEAHSLYVHSIIALQVP